MASGIVAALMVLAAVQVSQTAPPRDAVPRAAVRPDTASVIRGRVTDRESGQAVARAIVTLRAFPPLTAQQNTSSDAEGHFVFADLAPGRYSLVVNPPANTATYLSQQFGKDRPIDPARVQVPTPIELRAAETKEADIALWKALAIEGRVLGGYGEPLANIRVVAVQAAMPGIMGAASKTTDDRGAFRLFGLKPGEYRVCAEPTENATVIRSPDGDRDPRLRTCHANALHESQGQVVVISSADASGIDIRVQRGRVYYKGEDVTGRAVDFKSSSDPRDLVIVLTNRGAIVTGRVDQAGGSAQRAMVLFLPNDAANRSPAVLGSIVHVFVADDGTFRLPPIRAGEYLILALLSEDLPPGSVLARPWGIESLASVAERIVLAEHEERSIVLQLVKPR